MATVDQWIREIPVVTRTYMIGSVLTTAACFFDILSPYSLYYSSKLVLTQHQYWRIFTNFFFFGQEFSLDFLFHMFFLGRYARSLEEGSFRGRTADFVYMLLFGGALLLVVGAFVSLHWLGLSLTFMIVYVWARRNRHARMNFLGFFNFTAPYLPWVLLGFSALLGGNGLVDIVGIAIGHLYYFLEDVYPHMIPSRTRLLKTPRLLERLFTSDEPVIRFAEPPFPDANPNAEDAEPVPNDGAED
jgi:Derlin-2/3